MISLTHGQHVRSASWADIFTATVFSIEGYARSNGGDVEGGLERAKHFGHALASTIYTGAALYGDRAVAEQKNAEARANHAAAIVLTTGDAVEIEGRRYTVRFAGRDETAFGPSYSDPIKFVPAEAVR